MTITNINRTEIITNSAEAIPDGQNDGNNLQAKVQAENRGKPESELRAAARRHGLTMKELADTDGRERGLTCRIGGQRPQALVSQ